MKENSAKNVKISDITVKKYVKTLTFWHESC